MTAASVEGKGAKRVAAGGRPVNPTDRPLEEAQ